MLQFNSVVSAITSCFMAIVNGIVTICKAIINVRQTPHQRHNTQTTNAQNRVSSPSSPSSPTASPAARPVADAGRQPQALSRGTFDTRCHRKSSTRPHLASLREVRATHLAGRKCPRPRHPFLRHACQHNDRHPEFWCFFHTWEG